MAGRSLHRFTRDRKRFAIDCETCFCFECDEISWDVIERYPDTPVNRIYHELSGTYPLEELKEVVGELEWLRSTKSILPVLKPEEQQKRFEVEQGVRHVTLVMEGPSENRRGGLDFELVSRAIGLLMSRAGGQQHLVFELAADRRLPEIDFIERVGTEAFRAAGIAGKSLAFQVDFGGLTLSKPPEALLGHAAGVRFEFHEGAKIGQVLQPLAKAATFSLSKLAKMLTGADEAAGRIVVRPGHAGFGGVVQVLDEAGFKAIELDLDGAYTAKPGLSPDEMTKAMEEAALYYANRLLGHHYFRVDPIATLFWRIYNGTPLKRYDGAGVQHLAVDSQGRIFPSKHFLMHEDFVAGSVSEGRLDGDRLKSFEDIGVQTTSKCMKCWARNMCGGGAVSIHHALSGDFRIPAEPWCEAQRQWIGAAVAAFNLLSAAGINFTRMYNALEGKKSPSLFALARAAFRMHIGMRPLLESDAKQLTTWESWGRTAYFLLNERSVLVGNEYEREMDALHPRPFEFEMMLVRKDGTPFGLFKFRPGRSPGVAEGFVFFRDEADYASAPIQKSFRTILKEASEQQSIRRLRAAAASWETGLHRFYESVGFRKLGVQREALFTKGEYHDVWIYTLDTKNL